MHGCIFQKQSGEKVNQRLESSGLRVMSLVQRTIALAMGAKEYLESMQERDLTMMFLTGQLLEEEQKRLERQENRSEVDIEEDRPEVKREGTETQEQMIPRRSERSNKGIAPDQFAASGVRVYGVQYEPRNYQELLSLPRAEEDKWRKLKLKRLSGRQINQTEETEL
ncbi:hypothetical protein E2320_000090, partial [Naja naja]